VAVFGGIAPLAFTSLTHYLAVSEAPALYLLACATLTLMAIVSYTNAEKIKSDAKRREVLPTFSS
jgi:hypothetical protein